ncbi:MAG: O-antigen ligase family protein, partial [Hydrogenophaga sp.]|nr:O-antigen ligase family protein [Hydrogenophaga sp.]
MQKIKFIDITIFLLIILLPLSHMILMPQQIAGITGLNPVNLVWLIAFSWAYINKTPTIFGMSNFFNSKMVCFIFIYTLATLWTVIDIESLKPPPSQTLTASNILFGDFFKPLQFVITGWIIYKYSLYRGINNINLSLEILPILILVCAAYFYFFNVTPTEVNLTDPDYKAGRDAISSSIGFHANGLGGLSVSLFGYLIGTIEKPLKITRLFAICAVILIIVISFSRMSYLATLIIFFLVSRRLSLKHNLSALAVGLFVIMLFLPQIITRINYGVSDKKQDVNELSAGRVDGIWAPSWENIKTHPITGQGIYTIWKGKPNNSSSKKSNLSLPSHPHNAYLQVMLDMGLIGMTLLFIFLVHFWKTSKYHSGFRFALISWLLMGLTGNSFYPSLFNCLIWIFYGLACAQMKLTQTNSKTESSVKIQKPKF